MSGPTPTRTAPAFPRVFFEDGFGFERYAEWLIDEVPMYFVYRDGRYVDVAGAVVPRLHGRAAAPTPRRAPRPMGDFADHLTTVFTDVRLKRFLEMRGADAGRSEMMVAQSALWVGLLYDEAALAAAAALVRRHPWTEFAALRPLVARQALDAPWQRGTVRDLAREVVAIARDGLRARARDDPHGRDERVISRRCEALVGGGADAGGAMARPL